MNFLALEKDVDMLVLKSFYLVPAYWMLAMCYLLLVIIVQLELFYKLVIGYWFSDYSTSLTKMITKLK